MLAGKPRPRLRRKQRKSIVVHRARKSNNVGLRHVTPSARLTWVVKNNPKTPGTPAYARFKKYRRASTIEDFFQLGGLKADLRADRNNGYVKVRKVPDKLVWLVTKNPKKPQTAAYARFEKYFHATTVEEYKQLGGGEADLTHDIRHEYVRIDRKAARELSSVSSDVTRQGCVKVACLGDSNTQGFGLKQASYPNRLRKILLARTTKARWGILGLNFDLRSFGHCGAKVASGNTQYSQQLAFRQALKWAAQVYIIMLGTNDAHQVKGKPDRVESALEALVKKIIDKVRDAKVLLILPPGCSSERCRENMRCKIFPAIKRVGTKMQVTVVDPELEDKPVYYKDDYIHLSNAGAMRIAMTTADFVVGMVRVAKK